MEKRLVTFTRLLALAIWLAVGAAYLAPSVTAVEVAATRCKDVCDGCSPPNCKACAEIGGAICLDPKPAAVPAPGPGPIAVVEE